jgi:hypothetical protein
MRISIVFTLKKEFGGSRPGIKKMGSRKTQAWGRAKRILTWDLLLGYTAKVGRNMKRKRYSASKKFCIS